MTWTIRKASPADAAALSELGKATFVETFGHLYKPEDLEAFLVNHEVNGWDKQIASSDLSIRVVEADGKLVAYAKMGPLSLPVESERPAVELKQLYILGPWQGKGIARPMMEWVMSEARDRGAEEIYLSVWTENHRARAFYRRYGFEFVAPYAFMVGNQADEDEIWRASLAEIR